MFRGFSAANSNTSGLTLSRPLIPPPPTARRFTPASFTGRVCPGIRSGFPGLRHSPVSLIRKNRSITTLTRNRRTAEIFPAQNRSNCIFNLFGLVFKAGSRGFKRSARLTGLKESAVCFCQVLGTPWFSSLFRYFYNTYIWSYFNHINFTANFIPHLLLAASLLKRKVNYRILCDIDINLKCVQFIDFSGSARTVAVIICTHPIA